MITAIIIDYKSWKMSYDYVKHLLKMADLPLSIVVVDNSAQEENFNNLTQVFENGCDEKAQNISECERTYIEAKRVVMLYMDDIPIVLVENRTNSGFAKGNNLGIHIAKKLFNPQRLLITNNDIEITSPVTLSRMDAIFNQIPNCCIVGPYVEGRDGLRQSPHQEMVFRKRWIYPYIFWPFFGIMWRFNKQWVYDHTSDIIEKQDNGSVYRVIGAFLLADTQKFLEIGLFDEGTFLYSEEMILGEIIKQKGMQVFYFNEIKVIHEQGAITSKTMGIDKKLLNKFHSETYYFKKYKKVSEWSIRLALFSIKFYIKCKYWRIEGG